MIQKIKSALLYALTRELSQTAVTLGVCYGLMLGLTPRATPQWVVLFLAVFLLRVNLITTFLTFVVALPVSDLLSPLFDLLGKWALVEIPVLHPLYRTLYNAPFFPYLQFNNTVVMGASLSLILLLPLTYFGIRHLQKVFRPRVRELLLKNYFWRMLNTQHFERRAK